MSFETTDFQRLTSMAVDLLIDAPDMKPAFQSCGSFSIPINDDAHNITAFLHACAAESGMNLHDADIAGIVIQAYIQLDRTPEVIE